MCCAKLDDRFLRDEAAPNHEVFEPLRIQAVGTFRGDMGVALSPQGLFGAFFFLASTSTTLMISTRLRRDVGGWSFADGTPRVISAAETSPICSRAIYLNKNQFSSLCDGLHPRRRRDVVSDRRRIIRVELQEQICAHLLPAPGWDCRLRLAHLRRDTQY